MKSCCTLSSLTKIILSPQPLRRFYLCWSCFQLARRLRLPQIFQKFALNIFLLFVSSSSVKVSGILRHCWLVLFYEQEDGQAMNEQEDNMKITNMFQRKLERSLCCFCICIHSASPQTDFKGFFHSSRVN